MEPITFVPGNTVTLLDKVHTVTGISDNDVVHLRTDDNVEKSLTISTLLGHHCSGNLRPGPRRKTGRNAGRDCDKGRKVKFNAADHSDNAIKVGFHVREILSDLNHAGVRICDDDQGFQRTIKVSAERLGLDHPPCARTVQRWLRRNLLVNRSDSSFVPRFHARGGKGLSRLSEELQQFMDDVVLNEYMSTDKISASVCYETLCTNISKANEQLPVANWHIPPSLNTFRRWIEKKPAYDLYAARHGKSAADLKFRSSGRNPEQWGFMECVEVDHTVLDLMVVDEKEGLVLGRPRITLFIEWSTRACLGFTVGFEGTSTQTVLECLRTAVSLKDYVSALYDKVLNEWPCWGLPRYLKLDNGPEFHSETFRQTMAELGISLIYCPRKKPWFKGRVERAIKSLNVDLMATLPGATLTQLYNRVTGNDPSEYAVIDIHTLRHILHIWVIDIYHQDYHRGIKKSPAKAWKQNFDLTRVALPADMNLLDVLCTELEVRTVFHYGIEICGERTFNSPGLQEIRRRRQLEDYIKVKVRYRPARLDRIWVYDDAQEVWMEVMNSNPDTRDLSEFQLKMLHKLQREEAARGDTVSIVEARRRMKSLVEPLLRAKTQRARKRALKMLGWTTDTNVLASNDIKPNRGIPDASAAGSCDNLHPSSSAPEAAPKARRSSTRKVLKQSEVPSTPELPVFPSQRAVAGAQIDQPDGRNETSFEGDLPVFPTSPRPSSFGSRA